MAVTGHSAGLPNSLGITDFYLEGITGLAGAMIKRGSLLTTEQNKQGNDGKMYAIPWRGNDGFKKLGEWVLGRNEKIKQDYGHEGIWVACWNYDSGNKAQLVVTIREGLEKEVDELSKVFPANIKNAIPIENIRR